MGTEPPSHVEAARALEPFGHYAELRDRCPLHAESIDDSTFYVLTRYHDIAGVLMQPELWRNRDGPGVFYQEVGVLGSSDDPDHARHRRTIRTAFGPSAIARLEPHIGAIADALFDDLVPRREGDFVELFALPFPAIVIGELIGVRPEDRDDFQQWSLDAVSALTGGDLDTYAAAKTAIADCIADVVDEHRRLLDAGGDPPDDVGTLLAVAERDGVLSRDELRHVGYQLLVAGHETTSSLIGLLLYRLIERPELLARLRADLTLLPQAIEEALRFDSPVQGLFRTNADPCELAGTELPERTKVQMLYASANRDPDQFDHPDELDIDRDRKSLGRHLAFGWGIHYCIGAPLARLETRLAFERILTRMDDIELAGPVRRNDSFVLRGLTSLPLRWTPRP